MLSLILLANPSALAAPPEGWFLSGSAPGAYAAEIVREAHTGEGSARFGSIKARTGGFGTMMQSIAADDYRGQRIRMSAWVRSEQVDDWAGLWMRVDGVGSMLAFDNMEDRAITGDTVWSEHRIVLDVSEHAEKIAFGILVSGPGTVWLDDVSLTEVDPAREAQTGVPQIPIPFAPVNPSFED